jgi:outer membrane autotransporter protein
MEIKSKLIRRGRCPSEFPLVALLFGAASLSSSLFAGTASPVEVDLSEFLIEFEEDVVGDFDTDVTLSASGGNAIAEGVGGGVLADAAAGAIAIDGDIDPDGALSPVLSASFDLAAQGGEATATEIFGYDDARANTSATVLGVYSVNGDFSGEIQGQATGGLANASGIDYSISDASADVSGMTFFAGESTGAISVSAVGGSATAGFPLSNLIPGDSIESIYVSAISEDSWADASAHAVASGISMYSSIVSDSIEGGEVIDAGPQLITGTYDASAVGGDSMASGADSAYANSDATASAVVLDAYFEGEIDAELSAEAIGGRANAEAEEGYEIYADASAAASALSGVTELDASVAGTIDVEATGGVASISSIFGSFYNSAAAGASAVGIDFSESYIDVRDEIEGIDYYEEGSTLYGDVSAAITVVATGGQADVSGGGYYNYDAIEGIYDEVPTGADADAEAIGIDSVSSIFGAVSGAISASAYGGAATSDSITDSYLDDALESEQYDYDYSSSASASAEATGIGGSDGEFYMYSDAIESDYYEEESELAIYDEVSSDISVTAVGGDALVVNYFDEGGEADASAIATGISGDVLVESQYFQLDAIESEEGAESLTALSGNFDISATGGSAYVVFGYSFYEDFDVIEGDIGYYDLQYADASGDAFAVDGDVAGNVSGDFNVSALGGLAYLDAGSGYSSESLAFVFADAAGISGSVWGDFSGAMDIHATAGTAILGVSYYDVIPDTIEGDSFFGDYIFVDASAVASGIGSGSESIYGEVSGPITVTASGGQVAVIMDDSYAYDAIEGDEGVVFLSEDTFNVYAKAIALNGDLYSEEISADLTATAVGGSVVFENLYLGVSDSIESLDSSVPVSADAFAAGIVGGYVAAAITGDIVATATPGVAGYAESSPIYGDELLADSELIPTYEIPDFVYSEAASGYAFGVLGASPNLYSDQFEGDSLESIPSGGSLELSISGGVHAIVLQPEVVDSYISTDSIESGESVSDAYNDVYNAYAAAIYGGEGNDFVELAEGANIIGDINLNGGENELYVTGDTFMLGDILSSSDWRVESGLGIYNGYGTVDFDIVSGMFTAVGTVRVSDLADQLDIASGAGLAPLISRLEDEDGNSLSSLLSISGEEAGVVFAEGAVVRPTFNGMEDWSDVLSSEADEDKQFLIVSSTGLIDIEGAILDDSLSPYEITLVKEDGESLVTDDIEAYYLENSSEDLFVALGDVKALAGDETPGVGQTVQATHSSSQAVMVDISKRTSLIRSLLRGTVAYEGEFPEGAAGPDVGRMQHGDWLSYISAFGNIGSQDNVGGVAGFDYDTYGFVVGQEKLLGEAMVVGLAGSYAQTDVDGNDGSSGGDSELYSGAVYANWFTDTWYTEVGLTYGYAQTDTKRKDIANVTYTGDYDSSLYGTWIEVGYTTTYEGFEAEPFARVSYVYGDHEGFTDSGAGPNSLTTKDADTQNFQTEVGIRLTEEWVFQDDSKFFLGLKAAWEHEWADRSVRLDAEYLGAELEIESPEADRAALVLGIRGEWRNADGISLALKYEPSIAGNWMNHSFSGTFQYNW